METHRSHASSVQHSAPSGHAMPTPMKKPAPSGLTWGGGLTGPAAGNRAGEIVGVVMPHAPHRPP